MNSLFLQVKSRVTARQAAEYYGVRVNRSGMCCCIFHNDRHPSMKIDERYYCFSCHETGDVIDFTARLFSLSLLEAAKKLASDFGIRPLPPGQSAPVPRISPVLQERKEEQILLRQLMDYELLLKKWKEEYAPTPDDEIWDERFVQAIRYLTQVGFAIDIMCSTDPDERKDMMDHIRQTGIASQIETTLNEKTPEVKRDDGEKELSA